MFEPNQCCHSRRGKNSIDTWKEQDTSQKRCKEITYKLQNGFINKTQRVMAGLGLLNWTRLEI